jgi:diguanylate cyclase (GGDEF)-like protein
MIVPPKPHNERQRLETLRALGVLDTPPEERFDRVTRLASRIFEIPIALVSLVDADRQWFKSKQGLTACETSRDISFCGHAILNDDVLVVEDAAKDERFVDNPLVTGDPKIRFYAGYPLASPDGTKMGTLCVIDREPREFCENDRRVLTELGRMVEAEMMALSQATTDELTGVSNLRGFEQMAVHALAMCRRDGRAAALLYLDIKDFSQIGERMGAESANGLLVEFAQMLLASFRDSDLIGRIGTDQFAVLLTSSEEDGVDTCVQRLRENVREFNQREETEHELIVDAAFERYDPVKHAEISDLITGAEAKVYRQQQRDADAPEAASA